MTVYEKLQRQRERLDLHTLHCLHTWPVPGTRQKRNKDKQEQASQKEAHRTGKGTGPR